MTSGELSQGELLFRLLTTEAAVKTLDETKAEKDRMERVESELQNLRKALIAFMATVAGSAIVVSFSLLITQLHG